jgi:hypothetical protein
MTMAVGFLINYCFVPLFPDNAENWYQLPGLLAGQLICMMGSLMVVRWCGYRLVGRKHLATFITLPA